ncbi:hypothetical protein ACJW30_02G028700 [Castanea mollissima]
MSGPQCCSNPPTLNPNAGASHVEQLGGLSTYASGSPNSKLAILLITDVFGTYLPTHFFHTSLLWLLYLSLQTVISSGKLADKVAASGFYVVVPDFFHGEPFVLDNANRPIQVWLKDHGPDKGFEEAKPVTEALKIKGVSAVGAAGFCWGAKVVVELAKAEHIQAAVPLHPSFVTPDDIKGVKVPIAVLGAEIDRHSPPALLKQFEEVLAAKYEVDGYVKIFPKVEHGWTVRYNVEDAAAVKSAEEAHQDMLEWFAKYVK